MRQGEVETIAYNRDKGISLTVYVGQRRGQASTADFSPASLRATVEKAVAIARYTAEDPCAGLADPDRLARHMAGPRPLPPLAALGGGGDRARAARPSARRWPSIPRLTNSDGATVGRGDSQFVYANSNGFLGGYRGSRHHIDCSVIGEDESGMQRDYWYTSSRVPGELLDAGEVGRIAGERTARRLGARKLGTLDAARCSSRRPRPPT